MVASSQTKVKLWSSPNIKNLELLRAENQKQHFPKHTHDQYVIGVIEKGALGFYYRGENVVASSGNISLCIPDEVHTGHPEVDEGWTYRMFYFDTSLLENITADITNKSKSLPFFSSGVIEDNDLAISLCNLHQKMELNLPSAMEHETELLNFIATLTKRYADKKIFVPSVGQESYAVAEVKNYIESFYYKDIRLDELAEITQLSKYYLVRSFHASVGIPPHAYLRQVRLKNAKKFLAKGLVIADVAVATGFTDQSHLNRWFKRFWGFTPGQYRNSVQDN